MLSKYNHMCFQKTKADLFVQNFLKKKTLALILDKESNKVKNNDFESPINSK